MACALLSGGDSVPANPVLVGSSRAMRGVRELVRQVGPSAASVLVTGPSGSGKEVVARMLHRASRRRAGPFVPINCGAIPRDLFESELFGHEKGAFTGAQQRRTGRFEAASGGTLFLDEIGDMPLEMQVKLLRVLEERRVERVGGNDAIAVDVRVVSATHRAMDAAIGSGAFREDLFYRLSIFPLHLPALAERREDVGELLAHFAVGRVRFTPAAATVLGEYDWPGNVRELRNFVERAAILHSGKAIDAADARFLLRLGKAGAMMEPQSMPASPASAPAASITTDEARPAGSDAVLAFPGSRLPHADASDLLSRGDLNLKDLLADIETSFIDAALRRTGYVVADAARILGLQRTTLCEKMRKYGIDRAAA